MEKLRVGVVGVGYLGRFHAEKYAGMDGVELIGVVDINKSRAEDVASRMKTKAYPYHEALFGSRLLRKLFYPVSNLMVESKVVKLCSLLKRI